MVLFVPGPSLIFTKGKGNGRITHWSTGIIYFLRQVNMDYSFSEALKSTNTDGIQEVLLIYDVMCQYYKKLNQRFHDSKYLSKPDQLKISKAVGSFHVRGHVPKCFQRFALLFIEGAALIDGEILETLWSVLNEISRSTRGASAAHRQEILDDHMNHSNWKKMVNIGMYVGRLRLIWRS